MRCDNLISAGEGRGIDVALQRADDLDNESLFIIQQILSRQKEIKALDVACGSGGHSIRMALAGAEVLAVDILNREKDVEILAKEHNVASNISFKIADMCTLSSVIQERFDVVVCQRAIHYLPYKSALMALEEIGKVTERSGYLFISASGIYSELSNGYEAKDVRIEDRFARLEENMAKHHDILHPICLYAEKDLQKLLESTGFKVVKIFSSSFGNIKGVAQKI